MLTTRILSSTILAILATTFWLVLYDGNAALLSIQGHQSSFRPYASQTPFSASLLPRTGRYRGQHASSPRNDALLILHTREATVWNRIPILMATYLQEVVEYLVYSDSLDSIAGVPIRVPENSTQQSSEVGEESGLIQARPLLQDVFRTAGYQKFDWYILASDKSFLFWDNLLDDLDKRYNASDDIVIELRASFQESFDNRIMIMSSSAVSQMLQDYSPSIPVVREIPSAVDLFNMTKPDNQSESHRQYRISQSNLPNASFGEIALAVTNVTKSDVSELWEVEMQAKDSNRKVTYGEVARAACQRSGRQLDECSVERHP